MYSDSLELPYGTGWPSFWRRRDHESCTEGHAQVRQEHHRDRQDVQGIHGRRTSRDEGARPRAEGGRAPRPARGQGGRGKRRAREDRRDTGTGSRHGQAAPCDHQSQRAGPLAETLVRDARVCQGRQGRLLLPKRAEVQDEVRDVRLQRRGEPRRRRHVAGRLRAEGVDCRRRGKDRGAREESGELRTELGTEPAWLLGWWRRRDLNPLTRRSLRSLLRGTIPPDRSRRYSVPCRIDLRARCPLYHLGEDLPPTPP